MPDFLTTQGITYVNEVAQGDRMSKRRAFEPD